MLIYKQILERLAVFTSPNFANNVDVEEIEIVLEGHAPFLEEPPLQKIFVPINALFKAPTIELARQFWSLSSHAKMEFSIQVSRILDRKFIELELEYESRYVINNGDDEEDVFSQRTISFQETIQRIRENYNEWDDNKYINILGEGNNIILFSLDRPNLEYDPDENMFNASEENRVLFYNAPFMNQITREAFNQILPIIDDAVMDILYLRFQLPADARQFLSIALTNSFTYKSRTGKVTRSRMQIQDANDYNRYEEKTNKAISALAIVAANQAGKRYFSGQGDPRMLLQDMKRRYLRPWK